MSFRRRGRRPGGRKGVLGNNQYVQNYVYDPDADRELRDRIHSMSGQSVSLSGSTGRGSFDYSDMSDDDIIDAYEDNPQDPEIEVAMRSRFPEEYRNMVARSVERGDDPVRPSADASELMEYLDRGDISAGVAEVVTLHIRRDSMDQSDYHDQVSKRVSDLNDDLLRRIGI